MGCTPSTSKRPVLPGPGGRLDAQKPPQRSRRLRVRRSLSVHDGPPPDLLIIWDLDDTLILWDHLQKKDPPLFNRMFTLCRALQEEHLRGARLRDLQMVYRNGPHNLRAFSASGAVAVGGEGGAADTASIGSGANTGSAAGSGSGGGSDSGSGGDTGSGSGSGDARAREALRPRVPSFSDNESTVTDDAPSKLVDAAAAGKLKGAASGILGVSGRDEHSTASAPASQLPSAEGHVSELRGSTDAPDAVPDGSNDVVPAPRASPTQAVKRASSRSLAGKKTLSPRNMNRSRRRENVVQVAEDYAYLERLYHKPLDELLKAGQLEELKEINEALDARESPPRVLTAKTVLRNLTGDNVIAALQTYHGGGMAHGDVNALGKFRIAHTLVTGSRLLPAVAKVMLFGLTEFIHPADIHSVWMQSKTSVFVDLIQAYGVSRRRVIAVGDGRNEEEACEDLNISFHRVNSSFDLVALQNQVIESLVAFNMRATRAMKEGDEGDELGAAGMPPAGPGREAPRASGTGASSCDKRDDVADFGSKGPASVVSRSTAARTDDIVERARVLVPYSTAESVSEPGSSHDRAPDAFPAVTPEATVADEE